MGVAWEAVDSFSVQPNRFNYQHYSELNFRSDVALVEISINIPGIEYKYAGEVFQYWDVSDNRYQIKYSRVWLNTKNVIAIEPLGTSKLLFRPATYLYNWTLDIKARRYQDITANQFDIDAIEANLDILQQQTSIGFSDLRTNLSDSFSSGTAQRVDIVTSLNEINQKLTELLSRQQRT